MVIKDNQEAVDKAWERLYNRLEQEKLLNNEGANSHKSALRIIAWSMSLAAVFVLAVFVFRGFINTTKEDMMVVNTFLDNNNGDFLATVLNDGSVVYVADSTIFSYPSQFKENKREVQLSGEAFFDIKKNSEKPFFFFFDYASIEVTGTMFGIQSFSEENFKVTVSSGEVKVYLKNNEQTIAVKAGEYVVLEKDVLRKVYDKQAMQFGPYDEKIYFKDMPLADIIAIINKQNGENSLTLTSGLENYMLTASFTKDKPSVIADLICRTLNLHFSYKDNVIIIHE
jgi:ferric-dicitrate binding protein FerR (iron transport regulator)